MPPKKRKSDAIDGKNCFSWSSKEDNSRQQADSLLRTVFSGMNKRVAQTKLAGKDQKL
jgi:hypothetical protein